MAIVAENNRYALQAMMGGQRLERARSVLPESWPLEEICKKLRMGPPQLSELIAGFLDVETLQKFLTLIRYFMPEHEEEIMSCPRSQRVYQFCYVFSQKYFPLPEYAVRMNIGDFVRAMPLELKGMSYEAWHDMQMRPGYLLLLSLVIYPYEGDERDLERESYLEDYDEEERTPKDQTLMEIFGGARIPLIDAVQNFVGPIARKIPAEGWDDEELKLMTEGTAYENVGVFASWVMANTGCILLDTCHDDVEYMEGWGDPLFAWSEFNVRQLAKEWPKLKETREKIDQIVEWIEADSRNRFQELLEFLLKASIKLKPKTKKKSPYYYDPWDRWSPLEQVGYEEEEDYDGELRTEEAGVGE